MYDKFLALLNAKPAYKLSKDEKTSIEEALEASEQGKSCVHPHQPV